MMIKPRTVIFLALVSMASVAPARPHSTDSTQSATLIPNQPNVILVDAGFYFAGFDSQQGWGTPYAFRAGFGTPISKLSMLYCFVDYYEYHIAGGLLPSSAQRHDIATYLSLCVVHKAVIGVGLYYTKPDPVYQYDLGNSTTWESGRSSIKLFFIMGATYEIKIVDGLFLPVGLYFRSSYHDRVASFIFRTGFGIKL